MLMNGVMPLSRTCYTPGTGGMDTLINFGFRVLQLHQLEDTCDLGNLASERVMDRLFISMTKSGGLHET